MNGRNWQSFGFWLPPALGHALVVAWGSLRVEPYFAPWLIFPTFVGAVLGAGLAWLARFCKLTDARLLIAGTLAAALLTVGTQHWLAYRQLVEKFRQREAALLARAPLAGAGALALAGDRPPASFWQFLRDDADRGRVLVAGWRAEGAACWLSWGLDAMLVVAAAQLLVLLWRPRPGQIAAESAPSGARS
ncbi:MAG: hypothetical protein AB7U73_09875 [Pirellulales bacterium]